MTTIKEISQHRTDVFHVDPRELAVKDGWNARNFDDPDNKAHIEELASSIAAVGVRKPLDVFLEDGTFYISDGECRLRATMLAIERGAEIKTVPVINEKRSVSEAERLFNQIVGNSGKRFTAIEQAVVFKRLLDFGWDEKEIAAKVPCSTQHVRDLLQLQAAPAAIQQMVKSGEISPTLALTTVKKAKGDGKAATAKLKEAVRTAKASGKKKATAKHVNRAEPASTVSSPAEPAKLTIRQEIRRLIGQGTKTPAMPGTSDTTVVVTFPVETWNRLVELAGVIG